MKRGHALEGGPVPGPTLSLRRVGRTGSLPGEDDAGRADVAGRRRPGLLDVDAGQRAADGELAGAVDLAGRAVQLDGVPEGGRGAVSAAAGGDDGGGESGALMPQGVGRTPLPRYGRSGPTHPDG